MNWVLILVIVILAGYTITGYTKGFLKIVYSLISWLLVMVFVICASPHIEDYLRNETGVYEKVVAYCEEKVRSQTEAAVEEEDGRTLEALVAGNEILKTIVEKLPQEKIDALLNQTSESAKELLESYNIYDKAANSMAEVMIKGISFVLALILGTILSAIVVKLIGFISNLPLIGFANSILGLAAGAVNGLLVVWVAFYFVASWSTMELCSKILSYIYANDFLTILYEKNILLSLLMK